MDQKGLEAVLAGWQEVLRLQDWDIRARFADAEFMAFRGGALGLCQVNAPRKSATIHILNPKEPNSDHPFARDVESDLVHEMLHVTFWAASPNDWATAEGALIEQAIEQTSLALVRLKRAATKKKAR